MASRPSIGPYWSQRGTSSNRLKSFFSLDTDGEKTYLKLRGRLSYPVVLKMSSLNGRGRSKSGKGN
jgi:hypothetical protein